MKLIRLILAPILFFAALVSCQKEYITYSGESGVFFEKIRIADNNVLHTSFGEISSDEKFSVRDFEITLVGNIVDYDREFIFKARELTEDYVVTDPKGNVTATYKPARTSRPNGEPDYIILTKTPTIKAGENRAIVQVQFNRTNLKETEEQRMVDFILEENNYFKNIYPLNPSDIPTNRLVCVINEIIYQPWWWESSSVNGKNIFGEYSKTKSMMICDKYGIKRKTWISGEISELGGIGRLQFIGIAFQIFLNEEKAAGRTIYDDENDDGEILEMIMGKTTLNNM